ncbi:hypothetical protein [Demequina sp.]|uniref:hypothetical protein n=1 Tax=Demequina sp. TaxID=2050685 RepID=UPI0025C4EDE0|nr:hypothetical protein [Demequina sp.]
MAIVVSAPITGTMEPNGRLREPLWMGAPRAHTSFGGGEMTAEMTAAATSGKVAAAVDTPSDDWAEPPTA